MENNINNKAKFFALYFGQKFVHTGEGRPIKALGNEIVMNYENSDKFQLCCYSNQRAVELKPLSEITDEDAVELAKIMGMQEETEYVFIGKILANNVFDNSDEMSETTIYNMHCQATDYLRLRGYAVQWYDLTVEEQVSRGWVQLKEN